MHARTLDVTNECAVDELCEEIDTDYGDVDVLVNDAGFGRASPLEQVAFKDLRTIFETNVVAMLHLSHAVLPGMRIRRAGTTVNLGSIVGRFTTPGAGAYHITKYGVEALSLALRAEVRQFGVRVALIEPTERDTKFVEALRRATPSNADHDPYSEFKRRYGKTMDAMAEMPFATVDAPLSPAPSSERCRPKTPSPLRCRGIREGLVTGQPAADRPDVATALDEGPLRVALRRNVFG